MPNVKYSSSIYISMFHYLFILILNLYSFTDAQSVCVCLLQETVLWLPVVQIQTLYVLPVKKAPISPTRPSGCVWSVISVVQVRHLMYIFLLFNWCSARPHIQDVQYCRMSMCSAHHHTNAKSALFWQIPIIFPKSPSGIFCPSSHSNRCGWVLWKMINQVAPYLSRRNSSRNTLYRLKPKHSIKFLHLVNKQSLPLF